MEGYANLVAIRVAEDDCEKWTTKVENQQVYWKK